MVTADIVPRHLPPGRLQEEINRALAAGNGELIVYTKGGSEKFYSIRAACAACRVSMEKPDPRLFSFNSRMGACPSCAGVGTTAQLSPELMIGDRRQSLRDGALLPLHDPVLGRTVRRRMLTHI